jgi:DUF917 family protein
LEAQSIRTLRSRRKSKFDLASSATLPLLVTARTGLPVVDADGMGRLLFHGKITDLVREVRAGFSVGKVVLAGIGRTSGH